MCFPSVFSVLWVMRRRRRGSTLSQLLRKTRLGPLVASSAARMSGETALLLNEQGTHTHSPETSNDLEDAFQIARITHDTCTSRSSHPRWEKARKLQQWACPSYEKEILTSMTKLNSTGTKKDKTKRAPLTFCFHLRQKIEPVLPMFRASQGFFQRGCLDFHVRLLQRFPH